MLQSKWMETISVSRLQHELEELLHEHRPDGQEGQVAEYIPALKQANPSHLAASICLLAGEQVQAGDVDIRFTMQSMSKVITLAMALMDCGEACVFEKVGMEPTGDPFNSIMKLEIMRPNKPLNPMINAGAIAVTSLLHGSGTEEKVERILSFVRRLARNPAIGFNEDVYRSEQETADLNRALAYFMKQYEVIEGDVEDVLDVYFKQCAIEVNCWDVARIGAVFANRGRDPETGEVIMPEHVAKICKTFMVTCGMYNASGEFAIRVGIPAKSGVSGGIMGAVPHCMGIGIYSPALDEKGNSVAGVRLLQSLSARWGLSIF
ncbi:glutaminase 1 [Caldalkalibacillus thermarum]|uniref:glutaminase A n=1 Tax=Caldalkalibacillus thermarum TaxID=296745 RepID=UPI00166F5D98|nr:glutaminase A [Caldalkalibacillus thermarum]GGK35652.1 glutaminase 1 [Caldalkalibacillus thermarum]